LEASFLRNCVDDVLLVHVDGFLGLCPLAPFIKYISDKYADIPYAPITVPKGASFADMVALKGKPDIGDQINKKIVAPRAEANQHLSQADFPDFNDAVKLGDGKEKVDRLTDLISIFQSPVLDFSKNRAEGDDILGDAYEYLMRHFATESGKSKGQFYTPAEVDRRRYHRLRPDLRFRLLTLEGGGRVRERRHSIRTG
jgi:type I restriction-modification system DNA methylase subunit